jgi:hypothetical protein
MIWLAACLALAIVLVATAYRFRRSAGVACLGDLDVLCDTHLDRYAHISRLLAPGDFEFLASTRRGVVLVPWLRRERRRLFSLYLAEMCEEFCGLVAIGSLFANTPTGRGERFAQRIEVKRLHFEFLTLRLRLCIWAGRLLPLSLDTAPVLQQICSLRTQTDGIHHRMTPDELGALRGALQTN